MIVNAERLVAKREMWDHVAIEFGYSCAGCKRLPTLDDSEPFLLTGYCRNCWPGAADTQGAPDRVPSHLSSSP